jgi:hypothetical protein
VTNKLHQAERSLALQHGGGVANRVMATADGTTMVMQQTSSAMLGAGVSVRAASKIVAASNASAEIKAQADYVCDGVADQVEINAAIVTLITGSGGTVVLSEGTFTLAAPVVMSGVGKTVLCGMGMGATVLQVVAAGGAPINTNIVQLNTGYCELRDLTVDGNKANNASATSMVLVNMTAVNSPAVQRVRMINSGAYGLVTGSSTQNGLVRDCISENAGNHGMVLRAGSASGVAQPMVASGCTSKGSAGHGFWVDAGPVTISDCHALSNGSSGFAVEGGSTATLSSCTAMNNAAVGFSIIVARSLVQNCRAIGNGGAGFTLDGASGQAIGCSAITSTGTSRGFQTGGTGDVTYNGCTTSGMGTGFYLNSSSLIPTSYVGCQAIGAASYGFLIGFGTALIQGCYVYGIGASGGHGIYCPGGSNHLINGCRITNVGGHGIIVESTVPNVQITNNTIADVGMVTNNTYSHILVQGDTAFIDGNLLRDPPSGNRPAYGIDINAASDRSYLGHNETLGVGITSQINDAGSSTRRTSKLVLDYTPAGDLFSQSFAANTWFDVCANQTFYVHAPTSIVEIACRGSVLMGATGAVGAVKQTRLVIDSGGTPIYKKLSGSTAESTVQYSNILGGAQPVKFLEQLAVGNHTVKLQMSCNVTSYAHCRPISSGNQEFLNIQVSEYVR